MFQVTARKTEKNIVQTIVDHLNTYMVFPGDFGEMPPLEPGDQATAVALWALHTWTFSESFPRAPWTTPYLFVNSETPRAGKTLLIDLLEPIVLNPERTIDMTAATMFRLIEERQPCLFIDEIDALSGQRREAARGTLNGGYKHSGYVWRNVGQETRKFRTFCAKLIAGIDKPGLLDETVTSRCLYVNLKRVATLNDDGELVAPDGSTRQIHYAFMAEPEAEQIVREIQAFIADWAARYENYIPKPIPGISPRSWEIAMPLIQIAAAVGIEDEARAILKRIFSPKPERDSEQVEILRAIRKAFEEAGDPDRLFADAILATVKSELGDSYNPKLLGARMTGFGVKKSTVMTISNRTARGYYRHQFENAWKDANIND